MSAAAITRHAGGERLARHRHRHGYVAVVLDGGYVEAGDGGRFRVEAGMAVIHPAHAAHRDCFGRSGATVLNLPAADDAVSCAGMVGDIDAVARIAARDPHAASALACASLRPADARLADWPDLLADAIEHDPGLSLGRWAAHFGIAPASLSRGFARAYGVSPKRFRLEARARRAIRLLPHWQGGVAALAAELGFADQAHLTRAVTTLAGAPPARFRAKSVQA